MKIEKILLVLVRGRRGYRYHRINEVCERQARQHQTWSQRRSDVMSSLKGVRWTMDGEEREECKG